MKKENNGKLRIIPLGGLEKIGMNITAFEYEDSIVVVDCGLAFPEDDMLGIDLVIPDITYLKENIRKVKGFVITHGHEDHIGALSYVLREMNLPIYATKLTMGIIERKLGEHNLLRSTRRKVVRWVLISFCALLALLFAALLLVGSPYLAWDYSDPETAVLGVAFHSLEWLFVRVAPPLFLAALVGIFFTYKKE